MQLKIFFSLGTMLLIVTHSQIAEAKHFSALTLVNRTFTPVRTPRADATRGRATIKPIDLISQQSPPPRRIQFAPGAVSGIVKGSVVRGTRDVYLLRASGNQTMTVSITSLEQNAVFDIQSPNGNFLQEDVSNWNGVLPLTGDYSVIVSATRGNANYRLEVIIK